MIGEEILKCKNDPEYFIENYVNVISPVGFVKMKLNPLQRAMLQGLKTENFINQFNDRQRGTTMDVVAYLIWQNMFYSNTKTYFGTHRYDYTKNIFKELLEIYHSLPSQFKQLNLITNCKNNSVKFDNGSTINIISEYKESLLGIRPDILWIDNYYFLTHDNKRDLQHYIDYLPYSTQVILTSTLE